MMLNDIVNKGGYKMSEVEQQKQASDDQIANDIMNGQGSSQEDIQKTIKAYEEMMKKAKFSCPVHKVNYTNTNRGCITGAWLLAIPDAMEKLNDKADLKDLTQDTILFFEDRHIMELGAIMYGMAIVMEDNDCLFEKPAIDEVCKYISFCRTLPLYRKYLEYCHKYSSIALIVKDPLKKNSFARFGEIMKIIPFISYGALDEFIQDAYDRYKAHQEELSKKSEEPVNADSN